MMLEVRTILRRTSTEVNIHIRRYPGAALTDGYEVWCNT